MALPIVIAAKHAGEPPSAILEYIALAMSAECPVIKHAAFVDRFLEPFGPLDRRDVELIAVALSVGKLAGRIGSHRNPSNAKRMAGILKMAEAT